MVETYPYGVHEGAFTVKTNSIADANVIKRLAGVSGIEINNVTGTRGLYGVSCTSRSASLTQMFIDAMEEECVNYKIYYHTVSKNPNSEETKKKKYFIDILSPLIDDLRYIPYFPECYVLDRVGTYGFRAWGH